MHKTSEYKHAGYNLQLRAAIGASSVSAYLSDQVTHILPLQSHTYQAISELLKPRSTTSSKQILSFFELFALNEDNFTLRNWAFA